jgi:hypothetical protein
VGGSSTGIRWPSVLTAWRGAHADKEMAMQYAFAHPVLPERMEEYGKLASDLEGLRAPEHQLFLREL